MILRRASRAVSRRAVAGLAALATLAVAGCGDGIEPDEGFFDRYDACERMVSLSGLTRDRLPPCINWVLGSYPGRTDRILLVQCMQEAPDCDSMKGQCDLPADLVP